MNLIMNILQRFLQNPKTTLAGVFSGTTLAVAASSVLEQAGCHLDQVSWWTVMGLVFGGPAVVGGASTDNGSTVTPAVPVAGGPLMKSLAIFALIGSLVGCASYYDLGNGKSMRTVTTEERSPFGTNAGFMQLQECQKVVSPQTGLSDYVNCEPRSGWVAMQSQGQGGQVASGALTGLGFGLGSAFSAVGGSSASSSSSATSSAVSAGGKGH